MNERRYIYFAIVVAVALWWYYSDKKHQLIPPGAAPGFSESSSRIESGGSANGHPEVPAQPPSGAGASSGAAAVPSPSLKDKIKKTKLATLEEYKADVKKDPHAHSPHLVESALKLGDLMNSVKDEKDAAELMDYFKNCLTANSPTAVRTACYRHAQRLSDDYPNLKGSFLTFDNLLDGESRKVLGK